MITQTDIVNLKISENAPMTDAEIVRHLIEEDQKSEEYRAAQVAERYYKKDQDIKGHDFQKSKIIDRKVDPETREEKDVEEYFINPNRSNHRMQYRFLFNHVEQKVSYISGREPSITVDGAEPSEDGKTGNEEWEYQNALAKTTGSKFRKMLLQWERRASLGGKAWVHEYKDAEGNLKQLVVPRTGGVPIYDTAYAETLIGFIRYYPIKETRAHGQTKTIFKAEWWEPDGVTRYTSDADGDYSADGPKESHYETVTYVTGPDGETLVERKREAKNWGRVPFVEMANNSDALTDLHPYKDLIDAHDLVASKGTNNLMDFNEFYAVIQGFGGDAASAIVKKLEINRAVVVGSAAQGNSVTMQQLDMQMQGRIDWLKELWDAIHYFGCAVDPSKDSIGNAASGVSLEFQYSLLDLKANNMITEAEQALIDHFWFVTEDFNRQNGTAYDPELVAIQFNKSRVTNNLELVQMIIQSQGLVPDKILLQAHPLVKDADQAYKDMLAMKEEQAKIQYELMGRFGRMEDEDQED